MGYPSHPEQWTERVQADYELRCSPHVLDGLGLVVLKRSARTNLNSLRLHRFGHFTHQVDLQKAILERRVLDLHEIREAKPTLEIARGDSAVHVVVVGLLVFPTLHDKRVLLHRDADLVWLEASDRQRNAVAV